MLSRLDETLLHQTPEPFGRVGTSDHRFFDRTWFGCYDRDGRAGLITGIGAYPNMNVLDGFAAVQLEGRQYNLRLSRPLRPRLDEIAVGPLHHEVIEPLQTLRLVLEPGPQPASFDLTWTGVLPAHQERRHAGVLDGRQFEDYTRFDQAGVVNGWIQVDDRRLEAQDWFGARDHSWGVRRSVGGFEPFTGSLPPELPGVLFVWLEFATASLGGHVQFSESSTGDRSGLEGFIAWPEPAGRPDLAVVAAEHDIEFHPGTRAYRRARLCLTTADGAKWELEAEPLLTAWAYRGTGYDGGYHDGQGLGVFRGEALEHDVYDVSHPEDVGLPDGTTIRPLHREQGVRLTVNGEPGFGHFPIMAIGRIDRYGLGAL